MFDLFFWIIILAVLIPMGMRMYRRSVQQRNQGPGLPGQYPGQFPNQFPHQDPDQFGNQPGSPFGGPFQGRPDNRPRDGYTQQDYFGGGLGFPQRGGKEELPPLNPPYPGQAYPEQQYPPYPNQPYPNQPGPGGTGAPAWQQGQVPYEDSPEYHANPPQPQQNPAPSTGPAPSAPPPPSAPQGFRARKLAELDQQYSEGQLSMEEYMARRNDIMNG
ncbi:hypothetical protein [Arthrobacter globiformis]|uniref:SHOCT domain-containing protein n=1 Tax=Arthrobacter globiformis TaxID=1665 RepID=A0A328HDI4_ARTGO|nr:hypothetical protein [Arthrobacter globiformis]RAM36676.1 hypothetical protein DBZ45_14470 [Arthrobacter globiformis]